MKDLIFCFQLGRVGQSCLAHSALARSIWGPQRSHRPSGGQVKEHDRGMPPARAVHNLASAGPPLPLQGWRAGRGRVPLGAELGAETKRPMNASGSVVLLAPVAGLPRVTSWAIWTTTPRRSWGRKGSPCAVGATLYPISGGESDVTCELVTYERL